MRSSTTWKKTPEANSAVSGHSATAAGITVRDRSDDWLTVWEQGRRITVYAGRRHVAVRRTPKLIICRSGYGSPERMICAQRAAYATAASRDRVDLEPFFLGGLAWASSG